MRGTWQSWARRTGVVLIAAALIVALVPVAYLAYGNWQQAQLNQQWQQQLHHPQASTGLPRATPGAGPSTPDLRGNALLFALDVPSIGYYAAVRQGVGLGILYAGPGHYPQTAMPGELGTVGVAAHNTYWIRFGNLRAGDEIDLQTRDGTIRYTVTGTQVVQPTDVWVLDAKPGQRLLTLTTCWPLWAGALATQRLAIFAQQDGAG